MRDPRSSRKYIEQRNQYVQDRSLSNVTCCLCGEPINMTKPGTHNDGPTVEHKLPIRHIVAGVQGYQDAVDLACNQDLWDLAHRKCQNRQGGKARTESKRFIPSEW